MMTIRRVGLHARSSSSVRYRKEMAHLRTGVPAQVGLAFRVSELGDLGGCADCPGALILIAFLEFVEQDFGESPGGSIQGSAEYILMAVVGVDQCRVRDAIPQRPN